MQTRPETPAQRAPQAGERSAPGTIIGGRYTLRTAIGHGGMGTVWRAADTLLRRDVAVKEVLLPPGIAADDREQMYQRTMREARAAAALSHPSVVQVYDVVTEGGRPWIVMELLQSRSLAEMIIEDGPLAARAVAKIGIALLGALEVAHANSVLHRDVKPANVLICSDGRCVLTDFGVARMPADAQLTTPGMVLGSPHFISPERAIGAKFGPPSDLFSLGVTLYTAIEGHPPFDKRDPFETMRSIVEEPPTPPVRAGSLAGALYGLLEKDPAQRWNVQATRRVLRELLAGPLASNAAVHVTDPYAVVRPAPIASPAAAPAVGGQIGGRAMLAPGETISSAMRRRHGADDEISEIGVQSPQPQADAGAPTGAFPPANALPSTGALPALPAPPQRAPDAEQPEQYTGFAHQPGQPSYHQQAQQAGLYGQPGMFVAQQGPYAPGQPEAYPPQQPGQYGQYGQQGQHGQQRPYGQPAGLYGQPAQHPSAYGQPAAHAQYGGPASYFGGQPQRSGARRTMDQLMASVRRVPLWGRLVGIGCLAVVVLLASGAIAGMFSDDPPPKIGTNPQPTASSPGPAGQVQEYRDSRGFVVNVPATWTKKPTKPYVDFVDPEDQGRRLRVNVEVAGGSAQRYLEAAERGLKRTTSTCPAPYTRVGLRSVELDGQEAAELEYTCGSGDQMRHGIWRALVRNGKAYQFFVSVPHPRFTESKPIYDEMVQSYHLTGLASAGASS
ncbi:MAG: protein kinase [Dactylosporangium sp.]|nr:protein kinase [Dactylosporangium sp.]NNJ63424.1 protein kinase [Dactylosporangium sp.]